MISDERLDTLIAETAQTAGVEEAVERIAKHAALATKEFPGAHDPSLFADHSLYVNKVKPLIAAELTALLAERDAALNEIAVVWSRVALLSSQIPPKVFEELNAAAKVVEQMLKTGELQPTSAEYRATLGECHSFIGKLNDKAERFHFADADRDTMAAMLSRIDALTKGGDDRG